MAKAQKQDQDNKPQQDDDEIISPEALKAYVPEKESDDEN